MKFIVKICMLLFFTISFHLTQAATYYWVGGSGSWTDLSHWSLTSGGTISPTSIPSPTDDVIIDTQSFLGSTSLIINLGLSVVSVNSLICTEITSQITFTGGHTLKVHGAIQLTQATTFNGLQVLDFESQQTGNTINTYNTQIPTVNFQGIGGAWVLGSDFRATNINLYHGSVETAGFDVHIHTFSSTQSNVRSLHLLSSHITANTWHIAGSGFSIDAGSSTIAAVFFTHLGSAAYFDLHVQNLLTGDTLVFNNVWATTNNSQISGHITYNTLYLGGDYSFTFSGKHIFIDSLSASGIDCSNKLGMTGAPAVFEKSHGSILVANAKIQNIQAIGGAQFNTINSTDNGGNSGWYFPPLFPRNLYWVNGSGKWNDPSHWSLSSNGVGGECIPTPLDNVFFDNASFSLNDTMAIDLATVSCKNMIWDIPENVRSRGYVNVPSVTVEIYGSLQLDKEIEWLSDNIDFHFKAQSPGQTIKSDNKNFPRDIFFNGNGGEWLLLDAIEAEQMFHTDGTVRTDGHHVSVKHYISTGSNNRGLYLLNTIFEMKSSSSEFLIENSNHFLDAGTSVIRYLLNGILKIEHQTPLNFNEVEFLGGSGQSYFSNGIVNYFNRVILLTDCDFEGSFHVEHILLYGNYSYRIESAAIVNIGDSIEFISGCHSPVFISSMIDSAACFIHKDAGMVQGERLILKDVHTSGSANFSAIASVDLGNNNGWSFVPHTGTDLYWVNGSGNWSDTSHWSYSSGGPGGACIPTPVDNVFFDNNSFYSISENVDIDIANAFCKNMHWNTDILQPSFSALPNSTLWIFGSLTLDALMNISSFFAETRFSSINLGETIESAGNTFSNHIYFDGYNGEWLLVDSLTTIKNIFHNKGTLRLDGQVLSAGNYISKSQTPRKLDMRNACIDIYQSTTIAWIVEGDNYTLEADSSEIKFLEGAPDIVIETNDSLKFWNVKILESGGTGKVETNSIHSSSFRHFYTVADMNFYGKNYFDTLFLKGPSVFGFSGFSQQQIKTLMGIADCNNRIKINPANSGLPGLIHNTGGSMVSDFDINNVMVQGGGVINVQNGTSFGNTTGWNIILALPLDLFWVNGTGNWNDTAHWSFTSGGPGGACIPGPRDNVFFDQNSFIGPSDTVMLNVNGFCNNMTWGGFSSNPLFRGNISVNANIHGSLLFDNLMLTMGVNLSFLSALAGNTISTLSKPLNNVTFNGDGGWQLNSPVNANNIYFTKGSLNTMGMTINANRFLSYNNQARTLLLGNSELNIKYRWDIHSGNLNFNTGTAHILMDGQQMYFSTSGGTLHYYNLTFLGSTNSANLISAVYPSFFNKVIFESDGALNGLNVFDTLMMSPGGSYILDVANTQTIESHWQIRGNNCYPINLRSSVLGTQATANKDVGQVSGDFIHMRDINATGQALFYAGSNSTNTSNNSGWIFENHPGYVYGLGNDTIVCSFEPFILTTDNFNGGISFLWSDNSTGSTLEVTQSGTYWVEVHYSDDCFVNDAIHITYHTPFEINFGADTTLCEGDTLTISVDGPLNSYLWSNGSSNAFINITQGGTYSLTITDENNCTNADTLSVTLISLPRPDLGKDTYFCMDDSLLLDAGIFNAYLWNDGSVNRYLTVKHPGIYWVVVTGDCGLGRDTISLRVIDCEFYAPNVFTPNGDGYNDFFEIISHDVYKFRLTVFNRWGNIVFYSEDINYQWDGTNKGSPCPVGTYFWTADYQRKSNVGNIRKFTAQGSVTLIK